MSLLSSGRTVLVVADEALYIYATKGKGIGLIESVPWDSANFEHNVAQIIAKDCKGRPVVVLNDMVEQHYRKEMVAKNAVGLLDKRGFLRQELIKSFPNYPIRASLLLKEKVAGGKIKNGEVYIYAALPNSDQFVKSLGAVRESMALVSAFSLLPIESATMVRALSDKLSGRRKQKSRWAVFIGQHKGGGVRQIVIKDGELALTRMSPIVDSDSNSEQWARELAQEFKATMSYLARFGYTPEDGLDVMIMANPAARELLESYIDAECNLTIMSGPDACRALGFKVLSQLDGRHADIVHAAWASTRKSLALSMDSPPIAMFVQPRKRALTAAYALILIGFFTSYLLFANFQVVSALQSDVNQQKRVMAQLEVEYDNEVRGLEARGLDIKLIKGSLAVSERLEEAKIDASRIFKAVGLALGRDLRIDRLSVQRQEEVPTVDPLFALEQEQQEDVVMFEISLRMTYPSTTDVDRGNQEVSDFSGRIKEYLPDLQVEVVKSLKDFEYTEQVVFETGDLEFNSVAQDYVAEIVIRGIRS